MRTAEEVLESQYLEMRWRLLSLAADFDRIERSKDGAGLFETDARLKKLRMGAEILLTRAPDRAERFEMLLSDLTLPPAR